MTGHAEADVSQDRTRQRQARRKRKQEGVVGFTLTAPADGKPLLMAAAKLMLSGVAPQTAMRRASSAEEPVEGRRNISHGGTKISRRRSANRYPGGVVCYGRPLGREGNSPSARVTAGFSSASGVRPKAGFVNADRER